MDKKTKSTKMQKSSDFDVVVALDIGSTYCGYAWQWRTDFEKNMGNIQMNDDWGAGSIKTNKTKSSILLKYKNPGKCDDKSTHDSVADFKAEAAEYEIMSFGHQAEQEYRNLLELEADAEVEQELITEELKRKENTSDEDEIKQIKSKQREAEENLEKHKVVGVWLFFRRFKHILHTDMFNTSKHVQAEDHFSQHIPLVVLMSKFIEALKEHFLEKHEDRGTILQPDRILWVVTVPAIWSNKAKQLMRDAAELSGIPGDHLVLALEPEAAVLYCMFLPVEQRAVMSNLGDPGQTLLVVDLGGLTCDMSAIKVLEDGRLKEMTKVNGDIGGGQNINDAFIQTCQNSFAGDGWNKLFRESRPYEMMEMEDDFETKKIQIGTDGPRNLLIPLAVPKAMTDGLQNNTIILKKDPETTDHFDFNAKKGRFLFRSDYIKNGLFEETVSYVWRLINKELETDSMRECEVVVLVGGFAESRIMRKRIEEEVKKRFPKIDVVSPTSPYLAVMKGAVLFGHNPEIFYSRISRETYGIKCSTPFDQDHHDLEKSFKNTETGKNWCGDVFSIHVKEGQSVVLQEGAVCKNYYPLYAKQTQATIEIYRSKNKDPKYVTDKGCEKIGTIEVDMKDTTGGRDREVEVKMFYGGTELKVTAKNKTTGQEYKTKINFRTS